MKKVFRNKVVCLIEMILGVVLFLSLYVLACVIKEQAIKKYLIMGIGYLSIILFSLGIFYYPRKTKALQSNKKTQ